MAQIFCQSKKYRDLTLVDVMNMTEDQSWERFVRARWGNTSKMPCPHCGAIEIHLVRRNRRRWRCKRCGEEFSVTSGTPLANLKLPFKTMALLAYEFIAAPKGISANSLHARLGTNCRTAYHNLSKFREALYHRMDLTPLTGIVQIDGGHFCGKPRRPRVRRRATSPIVNNHLKNRKANIVPNPGYNIERWNLAKLQNRRIVLVLRQLSPERGEGAIRTIIRIVKAENAQSVMPIIRRFVAPGAVIQSDDGNAYSNLAAWFDHEVVRHSKEYSTATGVNNNQAESFMARLRRAEYGVFHGMRAQYFAFFAAEMAWREDMRFSPLSAKFTDLLTKILQPGLSEAWRGYFQGHRLGYEHLG